MNAIGFVALHRSAPAAGPAPAEVAKAQSIPIAKINRKDSIQVRCSLDETTVKEYATDYMNGAKFPPVVLFTNDTREYFIGDGFHRIHALMENSIQDVLADVRAGESSEALAFALGANKAHGLRMTNSDKVRAVKLALDKWPNYSSRKLGLIVGTSDQLVNKYRRESGANGSHLRIGVDGKEYALPVRETHVREPLNEISPEDFERLKKEREAEKQSNFEATPAPAPTDLTSPGLNQFADGAATGIKTATEELAGAPEPDQTPTDELTPELKSRLHKLVKLWNDAPCKVKKQFMEHVRCYSKELLKGAAL
jgi:hypothetical protein